MPTMPRLQIATLALLLICPTAFALLPLFRIDTTLPKDNNHGSSEGVRTLDALVEEDAKSLFRFLSAAFDGSKPASFSMSFSMATHAQVFPPTGAPISVRSSSPFSPSIPTVAPTTTLSPPLDGGDNSTKVPGRTTTITRSPSMSPTASSIGISTNGTFSPSVMPTEDSTSSVTDEISDHRDDPLVTPVHTSGLNQSPKPGFVAGMILLAVFVAAAVVALAARRRGGVGRMHALNSPGIV